MDKKISRLENLFSRKFIISLSCIIGGISLIKSGAVLPGLGALVTACAGYLIAEGIIDMKNIEKLTEVYSEDTSDTKEKPGIMEDFKLCEFIEYRGAELYQEIKKTDKVIPANVDLYSGFVYNASHPHNPKYA